MTGEELKGAFKAGTPVINGGITYKCVSAIIYRRSGNGVIIQAELQDRSGHSITIAEASRVEPAKGAGA